MKTYLFELTANGNQKIEEITKEHFYYKVYNEFLEKFHLTSIEENEDFVPYIIKNIKALMVLRIDLNEDLEFNVFDLLESFM